MTLGRTIGTRRRKGVEVRRLVTFFLVIPLLGAVAAPAAARSSTEELLAGMVTEEVEPGLYRVMDDGVRDLDIVPEDLELPALSDVWEPRTTTGV